MGQRLAVVATKATVGRTARRVRLATVLEVIVAVTVADDAGDCALSLRAVGALDVRQLVAVETALATVCRGDGGVDLAAVLDFVIAVSERSTAGVDAALARVAVGGLNLEEEVAVLATSTAVPDGGEVGLAAVGDDLIAVEVSRSCCSIRSAPSSCGFEQIKGETGSRSAREESLAAIRGLLVAVVVTSRAGGNDALAIKATRIKRVGGAVTVQAARSAVRDREGDLNLAAVIDFAVAVAEIILAGLNRATALHIAERCFYLGVEE